MMIDPSEVRDRIKGIKIERMTDKERRAFEREYGVVILDLDLEDISYVRARREIQAFNKEFCSETNITFSTLLSNSFKKGEENFIRELTQQTPILDVCANKNLPIVLPNWRELNPSTPTEQFAIANNAAYFANKETIKDHNITQTHENNKSK